MKKRLVAFLLVLIMVLGMLPVSAFAADDGVSPQALESNETQTIKYQILYVGDEFNTGYNYGVSVNKTYTCQYSTGHSGFNHSILISEFRNVGVPALKGQLDSGYEFVGWAKEAKKNPTIFDFNTAGTTATQTTYTIYLVAKKTNPTPTYMYYLYYKYNDGTDSTWLTDVTDRPTAATTFTFNVNRAKLKDRRGYEHIGWADKANAAAAKYTGGESITLTKDDPTKTIYAVWMPFFELKYDANGGTGAPASQTHTASAPTVNRVTFTVPGTIPTKDGCTFKGWADSATATDAQYQPGDTVDVKHENSPKTVYAVWQSNTPPTDKPAKPTENDVTGVVVDIVCVTTTGTHDTVQYPLGYPTDAQHTIGEVVSDGAGGYICPVTVRTAWFVQQASNLVWKVQHTPTAQTITFNLTYDKNSKTWVKPAANPRIEATHEVTPPTKPTALDGSFAIVCKNNKATHPYKADYIATPSQYTISDVQKDEQGYYVTATVTVAPNLAAYNNDTRVEHRLVDEQDATLTITFRYDTEVTVDGNRKWKQQGDLPVVEVICKPKAPTADELKKLEMAVQVKCVVDASQQHKDAYGLLGECDVDYFVGEPRKDGDDWLCDISYVPDLYVAEFNTTFQNLKHVQNDEQIVPVTLIWAGDSWQLKTQGLVNVTEEYTVTYTDGVENEEVFADQVYSDLRKDSATPAFNGTPTRTGYTFAGWEPEVAETVTQTVIYVAMWTPVEPKAPTAEELEKLEMAVQVKCVVDDSQQHTEAYGLLGEYDEDYFVGEPRKDGDDWLCDISYVPDLYVAEFNTTFQNLKHVQNDEQIVPVTLIWAGDSWQLKTQGLVNVTEEYTVTYTDGVENEEVFADQVYSDLRKDSATPAFNGTPTRTGYTFAGWEPEVAATVTQTVTYVAKWEAKKANVHLMIFKSGDLSKPIVDVPYAADKLAGDTIDLTKIDPSSYLDFDFEIDGGWYDDGMFNSYKRYLDGLQDKPAGLEKLLITGNWQNLKLIVTELVPVVYFDSLESLTAYQNDHSKTEGILRTTKARVGSALPTADAPTATRDGYTFTFWSREGQTVDVTDQTVNGWTNLYANWKVTPHNIYAFARLNSAFAPLTSVEFGEFVKLNDATLTRLGLGNYNANNYISIGTFSFNKLPLMGDDFMSYYGDEEFDAVVAELADNIVLETGVSKEVAEKIAWTYLFKADNSDYMTEAGYPTDDENGYQLSGNLNLATVMFEANGENVTGMPAVNYTYDDILEIHDFYFAGDTFTMPADPTREGYSFEGWSVKVLPDENDADHLDADGADDAADETLLKAGDTYTITTGGVIFTAQWEKKTFTVKYYLPDETGAWVEKKMDTVDSVDYATYSLWTPNAEDGYEFSGWYQKPADIGVKAKVEKLYMAKEWKLYGKFTPIEYTIQYVYNDGKATSTNPTTYTVESDTITLADATGADWGKTFLEWHDENGQKITEIPTGSTGDRVITAYWNWPVHLHYLDKDNNEIESATLYVSELEPGACVLPTGEKTGYDFDGWYEAQKDIGTASHKLNALSIAKKWELYGRYTAKTDVSYTVKYLREGDNKVLAPEKVVTDQTFDTEVTEQAADVVGYTPDAPSKTMILDEYNKVLTFSYSAKTDVSYTVRYLREGDNKVLAPEKVVTDQTFDTEVTENAADVIGYTPDAPSKTMILDEYNKVLTFSYSANTYHYEVHYFLQAPDGSYMEKEVDKTPTGVFDTTVTITPDPNRYGAHYSYNSGKSTVSGVVTVDDPTTILKLYVYYDLDFHTLTFDTMGGSKIAPETVRHGLTVAKPKDPVNGGYIFDGWYTDKTFRHRYDFSTPLTEDITIYAKWFLIVLPGVTVKKNTPKLNTADHFAYVQGYPDGTVKPTGNITRAETAAILFRLMDDSTRKTYYSTRSGFRDVALGSWYNTYVATLNNAGVITDSANGNFRPNEAITRAELAAMLANFTDTAGAANYFNDVSARYWAANAIAICAKLGWINGYPDGSFRPDRNVTRAELMAMINRATGRAPKSADAFLPGMKTWIDNTADKWYYLDVQEATNSHSYTVKGSETWTALTSDPNWSLYE